MRKLYTSLLALALMLVSTAASAWSYDIPTANAVLEGEDYNLVLSKDYDFVNGKFNGEVFANAAGDRVFGDGCFVLADEAASFKLNGWVSYQVVAPAQMDNFYIQIGTTAINLRAAAGKDGLHNYGSGARYIAIANVRAGQVIVCQHGVSGLLESDKNYQTCKDNIAQPASASVISGVTACEWEDITEDIHVAQEALEEGSKDNFSYWRATSDGYFLVEMQRYIAIQGLQIWKGVNEAESVTLPSMSVVSVNGGSRTYAINSGISTEGNEVYTFYNFVDENVDDPEAPVAVADPIYWKDTEEVDYYTYTDEEEGTTVKYTVEQYEAGELPEGVEKEALVAVYKQVPDLETTFQGWTEGDPIDPNNYYGEGNYYDPEAPIEITLNDGKPVEYDGNGDVSKAIVTIKYISISTTGIVSDMVTQKLEIENLTLNAPTLELVGFDGTVRQYRIGWVNNKKTDKDAYDISWTADDDTRGEEGVAVGSIISFEHEVKVTVSADGYEDGVLEQVADMENTDIKRKSAATDGEGNALHDWDFVNITEYQKALFIQDPTNIPEDLVEQYSKTTGDGEEAVTEYMSKDEYAQRYENEEELDGWKPVVKPTGWLARDVNLRSNRAVIEGGVNQNSNGYGYSEDLSGIFKTGLDVDCAPNAKNNSTIMIYTDKADKEKEGGYNGDGITRLGIYFMARPTLTFSREVAKPGEIVTIYYGTGGSNYTDYRAQKVYTVPAEDLLKVSDLPSAVHIFYIDVYTYEGVEDIEDVYTTAIDAVDVQPIKKTAAIYNLAGQRVDSNYKGIVIKDGKKVLVK